MPSFFKYSASQNILPFRESVLTDMEPEQTRLIEAMSRLDLSPLNDSLQRKIQSLMEKLACILLRDNSIQTRNRIRNFINNLEQRVEQKDNLLDGIQTNQFLLGLTYLLDAFIGLVGAALPVGMFFLASTLSASWMLGIGVALGLLVSTIFSSPAWILSAQNFNMAFVPIGLAVSAAVLTLSGVFFAFAPIAHLVVNAFLLSGYFTSAGIVAVSLCLSSTYSDVVAANDARILVEDVNATDFIDREIVAWQAYDQEKERNEAALEMARATP